MQFKVKVSNFDPNDPDNKKIPESVLLKIKKFTDSHSKYTHANDLMNYCKIPKRFFGIHIVCMSCGAVSDKATYAIAQNAMGVKVIYTCDCGFKNGLPQIV